MSRLWLRWIALVVFVAVLGAVFVNLGEWQLRRLHERRAHNVTIIENLNAPVTEFQSLIRPGVAVDESVEWSRVSVTGTFDADHQFVVRYRNNDDASGYEIVTPLKATTGATVLVDRGFVALDGGQQIPDVAPAPPSGQVTVVGQVRADENGRRGAVVPVDQQMRLINAAEVGRTLPYPILDGYIGLLTVSPAQTGDFRVVIPPELSDGPHFWYAVQWFMFTGIGVAGIVVFIRGDLRERRKDAAAAASGAPAAAAGPDPSSPPAAPSRSEPVGAGSNRGPGPD